MSHRRLLPLAVALLTLVGAAAAAAPSSRATWMGDFLPLLGNSTLLDLSLPGTHDTLTFDLSDTVADDANNVPPAISWLLHEFRDFADVGKVIRNQSVTQGVNLTTMLDGGVRFIDFRITYTAAPASGSTGPHDWYGLHFCQSNAKALTYLQHVRTWMDAHPTEVVVLWMSRHGSECTTTYPNVPESAKLAFWEQVEAVFDGLLFDTRTSRTNETTLNELLHRNHRMVMYVSDEANFTQGSPLRMNGCFIDNSLANAGNTNVPGVRPNSSWCCCGVAVAALWRCCCGVVPLLWRGGVPHVSCCAADFGHGPRFHRCKSPYRRRQTQEQVLLVLPVCVGAAKASRRHVFAYVPAVRPRAAGAAVCSVVQGVGHGRVVSRTSHGRGVAQQLLRANVRG